LYFVLSVAPIFTVKLLILHFVCFDTNALLDQTTTAQYFLFRNHWLHSGATETQLRHAAAAKLGCNLGRLVGLAGLVCTLVIWLVGEASWVVQKTSPSEVIWPKADAGSE